MNAKRDKSTVKPGDQLDQMVVSDPDVIRLLTDPLRIRLLEAFMEAKTTKQVADELGEKPTRLYHHVDLLEKAGLVVQTETRQNRGTLEKYFRSVARAFRAEMKLSPDIEPSEQQQTYEEMIATVFNTTRDELCSQELRDPNDGGPEPDDAIISFVQIRANQETMTTFYKKLEALVSELSELDEPEGDDEVREYRLTMGFYPLDRGIHRGP